MELDIHNPSYPTHNSGASSRRDSPLTLSLAVEPSIPLSHRQSPSATLLSHSNMNSALSHRPSTSHSFSNSYRDIPHPSYSPVSEVNDIGYDHFSRLVANPSAIADRSHSIHQNVDRYPPSNHFSSTFGSSLPVDFSSGASMQQGSSLVYGEHAHQPLPPFDASFGHQSEYIYRGSSVEAPSRVRSMGSLSDRHSNLLTIHAYRESHPQGPTSHIQTEPLPLLPSEGNDVELSYSMHPEQKDRSSRDQIPQKHPPSSIPMSNNLGLSRPSLNSSFDNQSAFLPPINESSPDATSDSDSGTSIAAFQTMVTGGTEPSQPLASSPATSSSPPARKKKKSKMHPCQVCGKGFPRPSGLSTHMNTHNNARPYTCEYPGCQRRFGVRSNAKRHLRTHGVIPQSANMSGQTPYSVGFSPPVVNPSNASGHELAPVSNYRIRWMPPSLTTRTNASRLRQVSEQEAISDDSNDDDDGNSSIQSGLRSGRRSVESFLSIPLQPAIPSPCRAPEPCTCSRCFSSASPSPYSPDFDDTSFEERNSFAPAGSYPYHPSQFRGLPGPAVHPSRSYTTN